MRQKLIYFLKHNSFFQNLYRNIMSFVFTLWGYFLKTDDSLVLFVSFMGMGFNDSPKVIFDYMQNHPDYNKYRCVWAFEYPEQFSNLITVRIDSLAYFKSALKAKYWITNTNIERGLKFKKRNQIYLNTWHGIALKHIGNDCPGRKDFDFSTVDYLVVSGDHDEKVWKSAFNANPSSYLRCGMPRNEELWLSDEEKKREIKNKLDLPKEKQVILYAPTWRESTDRGRSYLFEPPIHFDLWKKKLGDRFVILFRAHHQMTKVMGLQFGEFVRDMSDYLSVNELMIASDLLITDYSAIAFDYSILCQPILCYAYDYDSYLKARGTYFDIDEVYPNKSCRVENDLLDRILCLNYEEEKRKTKAFRDRFIQYRLNSTKTCVSSLFDKSF